MIKLLIFILFPLIAGAQQKPVIGEIRSDSNFICWDPIEADSTLFRLKDICHSDYTIEIRLKEHVMATTKVTILSWNKNEWKAEKHYPEYKTKGKKVYSIIPRKITVQDSAGMLGALFDSLRTHQLFLLPDQKELFQRARKEGSGSGLIIGGVLYSISFKAGNHFRRFFYGNPVTYSDMNPTISEFREMARIVELLDSLFYKYAD